MTTHVDVRRGADHDSVSLMQVSRAVAATTGVTAAQVAMATELNVDVLRGMGFEVPEGAGPNDLVVALRVESDEGLEAALCAAVNSWLAAEWLGKDPRLAASIGIPMQDPRRAGRGHPPRGQRGRGCAGRRGSRTPGPAGASGRSPRRTASPRGGSRRRCRPAARRR